MIYFLTLDTLSDFRLTCGPIKMNVTGLNFPRYLSILLLQNSKTDNNALDIDAIYNLKLKKT
jgi:hypothetical protein